jgi:phosphoribosylglycinamide formyltransferase 1
MKRIAILASGEGTNLEAILEAIDRNEIAGQVVLVLSDRADAFALKRANNWRIESFFLNPKDFVNRESYDQALAQKLVAFQVDLIVLAGFMRILSSEFIKKFPMQIINVHPSLLPAFSGTDGIDQAYNYGVKVTGCTVHFVNEGLDSGPVILQETVPIIQNETIGTLQQRIHAAEHRIYPIAIDLYCRGKLKVEGRRCYIVD